MKVFLMTKTNLLKKQILVKIRIRTDVIKLRDFKVPFDKLRVPGTLSLSKRSISALRPFCKAESAQGSLIEENIQQEYNP